MVSKKNGFLFPLAAFLIANHFLVCPPTSKAQENQNYSLAGLDTLRITRVADSLMKANNVPSYSLGIVSQQELIYAKAFGVMNRKTGKPATSNTLYQIGSITKVFTATLMAALRDDGLVKIADPVRKYLPPGQTFPGGRDDAELTLRHLATHTSGLPRDFVNRVNVDPPGGPGVAKAYSIKELYEGLNISKITGTVGTYAYSNLNFGLLGHVLERAAGVPYEQLLKQRILEPLQMLDSFVQIPPEKEERFATAYWPNFGPEEDRDPWFFGEISGAGGLTSSVPDLAKFISLQFRTEDNKQKPISGATVRELWTPQPVEVNRGAIAFGWHIREIENTGKWVLHGGEVDGFSSLVAFKPEQEIGIIVLTNFGNNTAQNMAVPLMEIVWDWLKKS